ncbi:aminoglycoside 6'-N-acetyltransferase [Haloactinopolyspora alba]|uniref:Aminoglycoside 6'-N-acetyltransferase n=1 Tax=Haloactinopolyspora alba TaxID=648780 RepID=A0A2P8DPI1_9ACTN|nr:GNAT family protein [Haloactinopolyspora alba]PSK99120.1 aminoglycoside 6'-N-acetyltransferase [Haloactinopolyspora alba]
MGELALVGGLAGEGVVLRPVEPGDLPALTHIMRTPQVREWWDEADSPDEWPAGNTSKRYTIVAGRRIAGMIRYWENDDPRDQHAGIEIFLDPDLHGRGLGRDAVRTLARHLFDDLGHHRLVIDPAATNEIAIRCCAAVGFRPVGMMHGRERHASSTREGLVMDLLATELR